LIDLEFSECSQYASAAGWSHGPFFRETQVTKMPPVEWPKQFYG